MRRLVLAAAAGLVASVAPASAGASTPDVIHGGCGFDADAQATLTGDQFTGVIYDASVTTTGGLAATPIDATVTCWLDVNGAEAPGTRFSYSGAGVQAGADRISYLAGDTDWVALCQSVTFADGTTQSNDCAVPDPTWPPQFILDALNEAFASIDPAVCPVFVSLAGSYGPVTIAPDGDVYVSDPIGLGLNPFYDCPPYGNF